MQRQKNTNKFKNQDQDQEQALTTVEMDNSLPTEDELPDVGSTNYSSTEVSSSNMEMVTQKSYRRNWFFEKGC